MSKLVDEDARVKPTVAEGLGMIPNMHPTTSVFTVCRLYSMGFSARKLTVE